MYTVDIPIKFRGGIEIPDADDVQIIHSDFKRTLVVGKEKHKVLHSYRRGDESRIFVCENSPDPDQPCEYCAYPELHDLEPAINGRHRMIHTIGYEGEKWVRCRRKKTKASTTETNSVWHARYEETPVKSI
jgi:hypothetical protein